MLPPNGRVAFVADETLAPSDDLDNANVSDPGRIVALLPTGGTTEVPKVVPAQPNWNVVSSAIGSMLAINLNAGPPPPDPDRAADVSSSRRLSARGHPRSARAQR